MHQQFIFCDNEKKSFQKYLSKWELLTATTKLSSSSHCPWYWIVSKAVGKVVQIKTIYDVEIKPHFSRDERFWVDLKLCSELVCPIIKLWPLCCKKKKFHLSFIIQLKRSSNATVLHVFFLIMRWRWLCFCFVGSRRVLNAGSFSQKPHFPPNPAALKKSLAGTFKAALFLLSCFPGALQNGNSAQGSMPPAWGPAPPAEGSHLTPALELQQWHCGVVLSLFLSQYWKLENVRNGTNSIVYTVLVFLSDFHLRSGGWICSTTALHTLVTVHWATVPVILLWGTPWYTNFTSWFRDSQTDVAGETLEDSSSRLPSFTGKNTEAQRSSLPKFIQLIGGRAGAGIQVSWFLVQDCLGQCTVHVILWLHKRYSIEHILLII